MAMLFVSEKCYYYRTSGKLNVWLHSFLSSKKTQFAKMLHKMYYLLFSQ